MRGAHCITKSNQVTLRDCARSIDGSHIFRHNMARATVDFVVEFRALCFQSLRIEIAQR